MSACTNHLYCRNMDMSQLMGAMGGGGKGGMPKLPKGFKMPPGMGGMMGGM